MKKTTQTISIFNWKRIILKGFTNKCNDLKGILIAVSQMFHLFDFFYSGHMCDQV